MNETLVTLSRQNTPYVYLAFSEEANRRAASIGQHYVAKIGHAGGSANACLDREAALSMGFHKGALTETPERWQRLSGALLGATDWTFEVEALVDTLPWARKVEKDLRKAWRELGSEPFDIEAGRALVEPSLATNGLTEVVRLSTLWMSQNIEEYDTLISECGGDTIATPVLRLVRDVMHMLVVKILPDLGAKNAPMVKVPTLIATMVEDARGTVRLGERGPRLRLKAEQIGERRSRAETQLEPEGERGCDGDA